MALRHLAKTKTAIGFGLVGVSGLAVNQLLFWLFTEHAVILDLVGRHRGDPGLDDLELRPQRPTRLPGDKATSSGGTRFAKSWSANNGSLLLRVPLLLVLAHVGHEPALGEHHDAGCAVRAALLDQRPIHLGLQATGRRHHR